MQPRRLIFALTSLALVAAVGCGDDEKKDDGHGMVRVNLQWSDGAQTNPFVGTSRVTWQVDYDRTTRCLLNFYLADEPNFQQNGLEGEAVFADWEAESYVCARGRNSATPECSVEPGSLVQFFNTSDPTEPGAVGNLREALAITDDDLTGTNLGIGPLPKRDLLPSDCAPKVGFQVNSLRGFNAAGDQVWRVSGTRDAQMITDQGAAALAEVTSSNI